MNTAAVALIAMPFVKPLAVTVAQTVRIAFHLEDETPKGASIRNAAAAKCVWAVAIAAGIFAHQIGAI